MWGQPYGYSGVEEEEDEEVDNDRPGDANYNGDEEEEEEEVEDEEEAADDEEEEPEYQEDSDDSEDLDEEEQDEEDARQLQAVAHGAPLQPPSGVKRTREGEERPRTQAPAAGGDGGGGSVKRNVVRINLRAQTVQPKYSELSDDDMAEVQAPAGSAPLAPAVYAAMPPQQAAAAAAVQAAVWAQPQVAATYNMPAAATAAAAPPASWQQAAVPDWMAHLPPAVPQAVTPAPAAAAWQAAVQPVAAWQAAVQQPAAAPVAVQPPWMKHIHRSASASALAGSAKQSSGSAAWGAKAQNNFRSTPGFYAESDEDDEQDSRAKRARKVPAVLLHEEELASLREECERVIKHRDIEGAEVNPRDTWATREFFVKWARRSYLHCTWETRATLSTLAGFKRIANYIKKVEEQEQRRPWLSPEECELLDVQKQMEEEMVEDYKQAERVIGERHFTAPDGSPTPKFLCKWKGLPYCEATYETADDLAGCGMGHMVTEFQERERRIQQSRKTVDSQRREFHQKGTRAYEKQPAFLQGGTLRDYQLDGLNWMVYSWSRGMNGILADEMGLGKTVQCAAMVGYLSEEQQIAGPFLVIVPLSTVPNWIREFRKWIPSVNAIVYVGDAQSREVMRAFEWETGLPPGHRQYKFDVIITTYEMVIKDSHVLRPIRWAYMMVDEAHRLKNDESALYKELIQWSFSSKLLVTGTPLQNNIRELWALLHFLHPDKFDDNTEFEAEYNMQDPEKVAKLHVTLRPHLLRRVIKDVEKSLPPKNERILRVGMTPLQRQYYRWILSRNFKELNKGARSQLSLLNIITELKKCCNHPFLFQSAEEEYRLRLGGDDDVASRLVVTSGKMVLLDKLLRRLFDTKHRVLIFSQMVRVLDIISDYMRLRGFQHQRLDGSTPAQQRHQAMDHFNAPGSSDFAFLLSTRAGGLGINLATADTVIIFDSDWNPQNDLQAMSRAHRIGQKDTVNIYRFATSGSVEEDILERAKRKMVLDHLVIQRMDTSGRTVLGTSGGQEQAKQLFGKEEMAAILRFGAEELFGGVGSEGDAEAVDAQKGKAVMEEDLDAILARAEVVEDKGETQQGGRMGDLLGQFNVATFKTNEDDTAFWKRLIPESERPKQQSEILDEPGVRSSRLRQLDAEQLADAVEEELPGGAGGMEYTIGGKKKKKKGGEEDGGGGFGGGGGKRNKGPEPGPPVEGAHLRIDVWPQETDAHGGVIGPEHGPRPPDFPLTLTRKDANAFVKAAKQRGVVGKLDLIAKDAGGAVEAASEKARLALWFGLQRACHGAVRALKHQQQHPDGTPSAAYSTAAGGPALSGGPATSGGGGGLEISSGGGGGGGGWDSKKGGPKQVEAKLDFFGVEVRAQEVLDILRQWRLAERRLSSLPEPLSRSFKLSNQETPALTQWMRTAEWGPGEDTALLLGCWKHGVGAWASISEDPELGPILAPKLSVAVADAIKSSGKDRGTRERHALAMALIMHPEKLPKASHVETRLYGILRHMEKIAMKPGKGEGSGHPGGAHHGPKTRAALRPPLPPGGPGFAGPAPGRGPGGGHRITPAAAAVKHAGAHQAAAAAAAAGGGPRDNGLQAAQNVLGVEAMTVIRKLRTLQRKGTGMDAKLVVSKTKKYISTIGARIVEVCEGDVELRHSLWEFVSQYTENQETGEQLEGLCDRIRQHHHSEGGGGSQSHHHHHAAAGGGGAGAGQPQGATQQAQQQAAEPAEEGELQDGAEAAAPLAAPAAVPAAVAMAGATAMKAEVQGEPEPGEIEAEEAAQQAQQQLVLEVHAPPVPATDTAPHAPPVPAPPPPPVAPAPAPLAAPPAAEVKQEAPEQLQPQAPLPHAPQPQQQVHVTAPKPEPEAQKEAQQEVVPAPPAVHAPVQHLPPPPPQQQQPLVAAQGGLTAGGLEAAAAAVAAQLGGLGSADQLAAVLAAVGALPGQAGQPLLQQQVAAPQLPPGMQADAAMSAQVTALAAAQQQAAAQQVQQQQAAFLAQLQQQAALQQQQQQQAQQYQQYRQQQAAEVAAQQAQLAQQQAAQQVQQQAQQQQAAGLAQQQAAALAQHLQQHFQQHPPPPPPQ